MAPRPSFLFTSTRHRPSSAYRRVRTFQRRRRPWTCALDQALDLGVLPRAFDRFARAEASRTSEGSGLGLAFVHAVASAHGGTARAENTGHGSAVILDLPC
ncbi:sensor histidine kinase [Streptomyces sp. NPDC001480]|uniref:sensor histidine kinase n=1 Tax=Streptomyces sp. NPDC001480 TaxID=3364577 RepID=UPI0036B5AF2A